MMIRVRAVRYPLKLVAAAFVYIVVALVCVSLGSVRFAPGEVFGALVNGVLRRAFFSGVAENAATIVWAIRAPRVLLTGIVGASLSIAGAAMQGLIKNPLADGSTLGVTSGGSLGAILAITLSISFPFMPGLSVTLMSVLFSFLSLVIILWFSGRIDANLSSNTIILTGIIFSMLASSLVSMIIAFAEDDIKNIVFWSMGSFSGRGWTHVALMTLFALPGIGLIAMRARELDAFAMGEEQAAYSGVNVKRTRLTVLICVSALCGAAVAICGSVAFIGLTVPHMVRMIAGPRHARLLPMCAFAGACFLMLCDLVSRTIISPIELPIGIVTSIAGAATFIYIFYRRRVA